ncbi:hypothetical protein EDD22DRAFT_409508 [Suillus occidentalis]|nr:hypothetical protein EDD22DRAFT_409508 [Suillus occidentalis]
MAPFDTQPIKSLPAPRTGNIIARSYQPGSMDRHTIIDIIVVMVIFVALLLSLTALACFRPTSLSSLRAVPVLGTSVPVPNTATPVRSTATPRRYSRQILVTTFFVLHNWWARASHHGIPRSAMDTPRHHEPTLFRAAQLICPRLIGRHGRRILSSLTKLYHIRTHFYIGGTQHHQHFR